MTENLLIPSDLPIGTYLETGGEVVLEGEHYTSLTVGASHNWLTATAQSGYTGTAYLQALPDIDLLYQTEALTGSPTANYPIQFTTPGTYTVWSRSHAPNAAGDSLYVGLNGQLVTVTGGDPGQWSWADQQLPGGNPATLAITTSGVYTLTTSMREDGLRLDRLLLTTATTYIPTDFGPTETLRLSEAEATTRLTRTIVYTYDDLYRLTEADYSTEEYFAYAYDATGNQRVITESLNLTQTVVTTYTYNQANQLVTARANDDGITWYYTFDRTGNLLRQTPGGTTAAEGETRYSYDGANRLVEVDLYTGGSYTTLSTAVYNGVGERLSLTTYALGVPLTTTYTTAEGQLLVTAVGTQTTLSLYGQTQIAEYGSDWSYPLRDSSSSVRQTTNQAGEVTLARSYKPFGAILAESGPYETAFGFLGAQLDQVSGLMFMGGRYYDPTTGRFLTPDHSRVNPYAPVQGPGIWLLLPLVGIVVAWKGRKKGAGRILVLVCVVGMGSILVGCSGGSTSTPVAGGTPPTSTPQTPTSLPTSTQTSIPTNTATSTSTNTPLPPTSTWTPTPPPPTPTSTPTPTPCPTPSPWQSLGIYFITQYDHASTKVYNQYAPGDLVELSLPRLDNTTLTVQVKQAWIQNVRVSGVAGWIDEQGIFVKCKTEGCREVTEHEAKRDGSLIPYKHVAYNFTYNTSLAFGDTVMIDGLGERIVGDTGGGPEDVTKKEKWLDQYIGIQVIYPTVSIGDREVWVFRP